MTREEKQKAIDALKISAPVMAVTQEEFNDYIQTLNKIMDWLEQEPVIDKIRTEIEQEIEQVKIARSVFRYEKIDAVKAEQCTGSIAAYHMAIAIINDVYKAESEPQESEGKE